MAKMTIGALLWRFATGAHLDGKVRCNLRTGRVLPHYSDWWWNRWGRGKRATARHATLVISSLAGWGLVTEWFTTVILLAFAGGIIAVHGGRKLCEAVWSGRERVARVLPSERAVAALSSPLDGDLVEDALSDAMDTVSEDNVADALAPLQLQQGKRTRK